MQPANTANPKQQNQPKTNPLFSLNLLTKEVKHNHETQIELQDKTLVKLKSN